MTKDEEEKSSASKASFSSSSSFPAKDDFLTPSSRESAPVKVYKRPPKKAFSEPVGADLHKLKAEAETLKSSGWKNDPKAVATLGKIAKGEMFYDDDFSGTDFSGAVLTSAVFISCICKEAKFAAANLVKANMNHSDFTDCDFTGANLSGADLSYCDFTGANLTKANLDGADLTGANLDTIIFSEDTDFGGVVADAKVQKHIDKVVSLQEMAERGEIDLRTMGIIDLRKIDLRYVNLRGVYLKDKDLKGRLSGVNLAGAMINESDILGADVNMIHYWVRDINDYNERMDTKAALRHERVLESERTSAAAYAKDERTKALDQEQKQKSADREPKSEVKHQDLELKKGKTIASKTKIKPINGKIIS